MKSPFCFALPALAALTVTSLAACSHRHYSGSSSDTAAKNVIAKARNIAPGLEVDEVEREKEFGEISWTVEGKIRGQKAEIEFEEDDDQSPAPSGKAIRTK